MEGMLGMRSGFIGWYDMQMDMYCCVVVLSFMGISVVGVHVL